MESAIDIVNKIREIKSDDFYTLHLFAAVALIEARENEIRKECADRAVENFWRELHEEADNQYDRRVELLGPVETAEDASYRKTLYDGWSAWLLAKRIVINRHAAIEGGRELI